MSRLTSTEAQTARQNPALIAAGIAWTDKALNYTAPGWLVQEGIRRGVEKSRYAATSGGNSSPLGAALSALTVAHQLRQQADVAVWEFVNESRRAGGSWADIAAQLGITKQAAQQKYGK